MAALVRVVVRRPSRIAKRSCRYWFSQWSRTAFWTASLTAPGTATSAISSIALNASSAAISLPSRSSAAPATRVTQQRVPPLLKKP